MLLCETSHTLACFLFILPQRPCLTCSLTVGTHFEVYALTLSLSPAVLREKINSFLLPEGQIYVFNSMGKLKFPSSFAKGEESHLRELNSLVAVGNRCPYIHIFVAVNPMRLE